jgi:hypothetical protein
MPSGAAPVTSPLTVLQCENKAEVNLKMNLDHLDELSLLRLRLRIFVS